MAQIVGKRFHGHRASGVFARYHREVVRFRVRQRAGRPSDASVSYMAPSPTCRVIRPTCITLCFVASIPFRWFLLPAVFPRTPHRPSFQLRSSKRSFDTHLILGSLVIQHLFHLDSCRYAWPHVGHFGEPSCRQPFQSSLAVSRNGRFCSCNALVGCRRHSRRCRHETRHQSFQQILPNPTIRKGNNQRNKWMVSTWLWQEATIPFIRWENILACG